MTRIRTGLVLGLLLAVAACGGGDKGGGVASLGGAGSATSTTTPVAGGSDRQKALDWARCMRQHGIDMPDPSTEQVMPEIRTHLEAALAATQPPRRPSSKPGSRTFRH
jgi:hypothetical protein